MALPFVRDLSGVSETMLITLYLRAVETQRADALLTDTQAVALVKQLSDEGLYDFERVRSLHMSAENQLVIILRSREFDRRVRDFLARHPGAVVVNIGCGLDARFSRVDDGRVEWYDLDLPDVIDLRRQLMGSAGDRHHLLACSVLEPAWLEVVAAQGKRPCLFVAEGVFMYFQGAQVKALVLALRDHFPGAELVFDAYSPLHVLRSNVQMARAKIRFQARWGIWHGQELEAWGDGIHLLGEWGYFECSEPRLQLIRWLRPIEELARTIRIYRFQLGHAAP